MKCGQLSYPIDVAISLDHISLSAVALGLGTCWIGMFDEAKVRKIIHIPEEIRLVSLMVLGYPTAPTATEKKRLPMNQIVKYNRW
jgi:nitroreductase